MTDDEDKHLFQAKFDLNTCSEQPYEGTNGIVDSKQLGLHLLLQVGRTSNECSRLTCLINLRTNTLILN